MTGGPDRISSSMPGHRDVRGLRRRRSQSLDAVAVGSTSIKGLAGGKNTQTFDAKGMTVVPN